MSTQEQRERFTEWWLRKCAHEFEEKERFYAEQAAWAAWQAAEVDAIERCIRAIEIQEGWNAGARSSIAAIRALLPKEES